MLKKAALLACLVVLLVQGFEVHGQSGSTPEPSHPRLWLRAKDLPRLRSWAVDSNPIYKDGLAVAAAEAKTLMDNGTIPQKDTGSTAYEDYPTESYAALFALMSLVDPNETARKDYAARARTLLMAVMQEAAKGAAADQPFRDPAFAIGDRSRWYGVNFALTVDWIYPSLSKEDKETIRAVFTRWADENQVAETTTSNHPEPQNVINDPVLLKDRLLVRWSNNNYYTSHMRNIGLMALALDPADDPSGAMAKHLQRATGAWLYIVDHMLRTDAAGGLGAEGFEYSPQTLGYTAQFLLALYTAGITDETKFGKQISFAKNPFWDDALKAYAHSLSPATMTNPDYGTVYQPAWYGSAQDYLMPDQIEMFGAMGVYDLLSGNTARYNAIRWLQTNTAPGGAERTLDRVRSGQSYHKAALYFLLTDPAVTPTSDPRPGYPTLWYAPGMRRLLARTGWDTNAAWFTYSLSWDNVDHQSANGNAIEFYRGGEWLTKVRVGYDLDYLTSDNLNTLAIENNKPSQTDYRAMIGERGSQWLYSAGEPPAPVHSSGKGYVFAQGDSTNLYNSQYENLLDVTHASRAVLWLQPDVIVVYDRATTKSPNRFKRFHLNFPAEGKVNGRQVTMTTASGQALYVTSVLPEKVTVQVAPLKDEPSGGPAHFEPMAFRLTVDATGNPADVRFLTVLQGANKGGAALKIEAIKAQQGVDGVLVGDTAVFFPVAFGTPITQLNLTAPGAATRIVITGLQAGSRYDVKSSVSGSSRQVTVAPGSALTADSAGVVVVTP